MTQHSVAHRHDMNHFGLADWPDGRVPWLEASAPNLTGGPDEQRTGRLRACAYCGSMHPADVAAAIRAGAHGSWADRKYGWPHKAYFDGIPNPHAGLLESRAFSSHPPEGASKENWRRVHRGFNPRTGDPEFWWAEAGRPADPTTHGKFYTVHLQDATPDERASIEQHLGLTFEFSDEGRSVRWCPIQHEAQST